MTVEKPRPQGAQINDATDPLGLRAGIESAQKILADREGRQLSPKAIQEAEEAAYFAQSLGLEGGSFRKAMATLEKHREEMDLSGENDDQAMADAVVTNKQSLVAIEDQLMSQALELSGLKTKKETVEEALRLLIAMKKQDSIWQFRGKLTWVGDVDVMREDPGR